MVPGHNRDLAQLCLSRGPVACANSHNATGPHSEKNLYSGNRESLRMALFSRESILWWVLTTFHRRRKQYREFFNTRPSSQLTYVELRNPTEARHFLAGLDTTVQTSGRYATVIRCWVITLTAGFRVVFVRWSTATISR